MMLNYCYCVINVYQGIMSFDCFTSVLINYKLTANNECRLIPQKSLSCALQSERTPLRTNVSLNENQSMLLKVINRQYIQFVTFLHPQNFGSVTQRFMEKFLLSSLLSIFHAPKEMEPWHKWGLSWETYRVRVFQILLHLGIAEDGVAFADSPQHPLKGLDLHSLNKPRDETARKQKENIPQQFMTVNKALLSH